MINKPNKPAKSQGMKFADHGTKELQAKGFIRVRNIENGAYRQAYVTNQTVIERLYYRGQISEIQYSAARRLQADYLRARLSVDLKARNIVELTNISNNFHDKLIDYCYLDAKKNFDKAMECFSVCGDNKRFYQKLVTFVIVKNGYLKDLRYQKQQNKTFSKITLMDLHECLDLLVDYYRFNNKCLKPTS